MVLADSHEISRVPRYSGYHTHTTQHQSIYTTLTLSGQPSQTVQLPTSHGATLRQKSPTWPTTPNTQRPPPLTRIWFSLLRFRSPLLTEYLFLRVLRCFTSPRSPPPPYTRSDDGNPAQPRLGSPIGHPRIITLARQLPDGISQAATSFISS